MTYSNFRICETIGDFEVSLRIIHSQVQRSFSLEIFQTVTDQYLYVVGNDENPDIQIREMKEFEYMLVRHLLQKYAQALI